MGGGASTPAESAQTDRAAIQKEMERILKEKEEEMKREREELQRKHEEEMEEMKRRMEEQREELKELKENLKKEREERKKEQEQRPLSLQARRRRLDDDDDDNDDDDDDEGRRPVLTRSSSLEWLPPDMSELRVVLLGNSWSQRSSVGNFILGEKKFNNEEEPDCCQREKGQVKEKEMILINTPDLLHPDISEDKLTEHVKTCERLSDPGPHVFLLVLQPEDFTEEHKLKLCRVLQRFSDRSFDHSLILVSTPREESPGFMEKYMEHRPLRDMIKKCRYRHLNRRNIEHSELLTRLGQVVKENNGEHLR